MHIYFVLEIATLGVIPGEKPEGVVVGTFGGKGSRIAATNLAEARNNTKDPLLCSVRYVALPANEAVKRYELVA